MLKKLIIAVSALGCLACSKTETPAVQPVQKIALTRTEVNGVVGNNRFYNVSIDPSISISFSAPINPGSLNTALSLQTPDGSNVPFSYTLAKGDSMIMVTTGSVTHLSQYNLQVKSTLRSKTGAIPDSTYNITLVTAIDSTDKFPRISDDQLLDLVQKQTFRYFREFAHPVSGMARDRNQNPDLVTTGGTGMGVMAIVTAIHRGFISRQEGLEQVVKIVDFLRNKATTYHGAYAHFMNGATGATIPFSPKDNGADLVETSLLMQGLLTARQYFSGIDETEKNLRLTITDMFDQVEWNWFTKNSGNVLYWHWSPEFQWDLNLPVSGWNEALITYVLAAAPGQYSISKTVYDQGWAKNGAMRNNKNYFNIKLPLGEEMGGPLFFSHYSFLGIKPQGLKVAYADYGEQVVAHSRINYEYAVSNPRNHNGYSSSVWGLTASDNNYSGYAAHSPTNDLGVIAPTAAISSLPFTPDQSLEALRFFYYKLGDRLFGDYGFKDAFNLTDVWFAPSWLAIDQGPQIIMIENYRSGLLWNLFMSCPEVQSSLTKLGFTY